MKKKIWIGVAAFIVIIIIIIVAGALWLSHGAITPLKEKIFNKIFFPIALVNNKPIGVQEYLFRYALAQEIYSTQGTMDETQLKQSVYLQLIQDEETRQLAASKGVTASGDQINQQYQNIQANTQTKASSSLESILKVLGLSAEQFKTEILQPQILKTNLTVWFNGQKDLNQAAFDKAAQMQTDLNQGQQFADLAKNYSDSPSDQSLSGDLGFVDPGSTIPELQQGIAGMKAGDVKLIVTRFGLHLVKVEATDNLGANGAIRYHLREIFIQPASFDSWLSDQTKNYSVKEIVKI